MFLILPEPPSLNTYYTVQRRGKFHSKVVSKEGKQYQNELLQIMQLLKLPKFSGDLEITLDCFPKKRNQRDIDNYFKCLNDSLQYAGIIENDNMIRWQLGRMQVKNPGWPCVILEIKPHDYKPITLANRIAEIRESGQTIAGLSLAPKSLPVF